MLKLTDLIKLSNISLSDFKIHCATGITSSPLEAFFDGKWKQWQEIQNQKNFECKQIISLIHLNGSQWLFAGIFEVLGVKQGPANRPNGYEYTTIETPGVEHLTGRAIINFNKNFRASYLRGEKFGHELIVSAIRDQQMTIGDFPGFNRVLLSIPMLRTIIREKNPSWLSALGNVAGIYVITDNFSGKLYVGSACGGIGIWQRWSAYAKTGHGGNKELRKLLELNGEDHALSMQIAILEVCDINASDEFILGRESHWKEVLRSREFGLNAN